MSGKKQNLSKPESDAAINAVGYRFGILVSDWNKTVTDALLDGALGTLRAHGVADRDVMVHRVPGSYELPQGAAFMIRHLPVDVVICLGCVIQGETRHFEFISQAVAQGCMQVGLQTSTPVVFGVLTTDTFQQAVDRSGGKHGNKGDEAALTAIQMADLGRKLRADGKAFREALL